MSPLIVAVQSGDASAVHELLDASEHTFCCDNDSTPLLICAVAARNPAILHALLRHAASLPHCRVGCGREGSVSTCSGSDTNPHSMLNTFHDSATVSYLLPTPESCYHSPSSRASSHSALRHLLAQRDDEGNTALMHACADGQGDMVRLLLGAFAVTSADSDADWNVLNNAQLCPVQAACRTGGAAVVRVLVEWVTLRTGQQYGERPCTVMSSDVWDTSLREAVCAQRYEVVDVLLLSGLCGDVDGALPADARGTTEAARQLRRDMHGCLAVKQPLLHVVVSHCDDVRMVELLLRHKASVDSRDIGGATPLMDACLFGHVRAAQALLAAGADVNACDDGGMTPLLMGIEHGCVVKMLVRARADVNASDETGWHSLIWALCDRRASWGDPAWLDQENDEDEDEDDSSDAEGERAEAVNQVDGVDGEDTQAFAENDDGPPSGIPRQEWERGGARKGVVARLLRARADVCVVDVNGMSTLMHAIDNADITIVRMLLHATALQLLGDASGGDEEMPLRAREQDYVNKSP